MRLPTERADVYKDPTSSHYNVKIKRGEEGDVYDSALESDSVRRSADSSPITVRRRRRRVGRRAYRGPMLHLGARGRSEVTRPVDRILYRPNSLQ